MKPAGRSEPYLPIVTHRLKSRMGNAIKTMAALAIILLADGCGAELDNPKAPAKPTDTRTSSSSNHG
jgi:hypothetical protein